MEKHQPSPESSSEECTVLEAPPPDPNGCLLHTGKVVELYCRECSCAVCDDCICGDHEGHSTTPIRQALELQRTTLKDGLESAKTRLPQISDTLSLVKEILQQLTNQRASIEEDIQSSFEDLHKQLDVRKSVLMMELEVTYGLKQKVLQAQVDSLLRGEGDIQDSCAQTEETLAGEACAASLQAEQGLAERLEELTNQGLPCHPEENDQLDLILETDGLRKSIHNLGAVVSTSAVASQSEAMGAGLEQCIVGQPASVTIVTRDKSGGACRSGNAILSAEVFTPDGSMVDGDILDHKNGTYEFIYTLPKEGHFSLALRLYDQHIKGSPFKLTVSRPSDIDHEVSSPPTTTATSSAANATPSTGSSEGAKRRGKSPAQKKKASKRASSALGTPRRKTHNPIEDDLIFRIGSKGRNRGEFTNLQGVAASSSGKILIADSNNQCVQTQIQWQVAIEERHKSDCAGAFIGGCWVLTAAHCVGTNPTYFRVKFSIWTKANPQSTTDIVPVKSIIIHPRYNASNYQNDIALIELERLPPHTDICVEENPAISAVCVPWTTQLFSAPHTCSISGWGRTADNIGSNVLLYANVSLIENCEKFYQDRFKPGMMCAGDLEGRVDSCQGDSGGPLVCEDELGVSYLWGIVSWGAKCAEPGFPGVYTKVAHYFEWIRYHIGWPAVTIYNN
ncbi:unnamed protein product [Lota lota]